MKWAPALLAIAPSLLLVGCQQGPGAGIDPFGRTTIPPPGTGAAAIPGVADPYYSGSTATAPNLVPLAQSTSSASSANWTAPGGEAAAPRLRPVPSELGTTRNDQVRLATGTTAHGDGGVATAQYNSAAANHTRPPSTTAGSGHVWSTPNVTAQPASFSPGPSGRIDLSQLPQRSGTSAASRSTTRGGFRSSTSSGRYGHADDYSWLKGRLEYSASLRQWKLRYIPIDGQTDNYGGSVILPSLPQLENRQAGDFVMVRGQLQAGDSQSTDFAAKYRVGEMSALR